MTAYAAVAADTRALSNATEPDNRMVWDGAARGHYEVWYLTFNHVASKTGFWIRYTLESPLSEKPYAQLWFAFFDAIEPRNNFALNRRFPIERLRADGSPFKLELAGAVLAHDMMKGALEGDGHQARWDLSWLPAPSTHRHLPDVIYKTSFADTRVLAPGLDVPLRGTVTVDGRTLTLEGDPGGQTHLWGRKHAHAWAWGHCNGFDGRRGAALEALSVRLKRRGVVLPPLTLVSLYLDGEAHKLTGFEHTVLNRGRFGTARFQFLARGTDVRIGGEYVCRPEDMFLTEYADPDGEPSYCANTEVADLRVTVWRRSRVWKRWQEQARLVADKTGHFEVAGRAPDAAIVRRHVTVA
jgi:hypothetical protein